MDPTRYNKDWELSPEQAYNALHPGGVLDRKSVVVLDLRNEDDFQAAHFPGSRNLDVNSRNLPNPYKDTATLTNLFSFFEARLSSKDAEFGQSLQGKKVLLLCYNGLVSKLASSVLRHRGVEALSVLGGSDA